MKHIKLFESFNASNINENKDWDKENWLLHNAGIDYGGTIKDIVNKAKNYPLVPIELNRIDVVHSYDSNERERASKADYTKFPIVAVDLGKNGIGVLDGNHRVFQARQDGETELKGYLIPLEDIEEYTI
jgi:hypothetical protein